MVPMVRRRCCRAEKSNGDQRDENGHGEQNEEEDHVQNGQMEVRIGPTRDQVKCFEIVACGFDGDRLIGFIVAHGEHELHVSQTRLIVRLVDQITKAKLKYVIFPFG